MLVLDFDPSCAKKYVDQGYNIVIVDVLRASSTIITALEKNATCVFSCAEIEDAKKLRDLYNCILVGERGAQIIEGFDFTNSPYDLDKQNLSGKMIAITTSTGTRLLQSCNGSNNILIGSTINARSVAEKMKLIGGKWAIIGAGSKGEFRLEDKVGCALIAKYFMHIADHKIRFMDKIFIYRFSHGIKNKIKKSPSTTKLLKLGRECDVNYVIERTNCSTKVPMVNIEETLKVGYLVIK